MFTYMLFQNDENYFMKLQDSKFGNATSKSVCFHCSEILFWHHLHESLSGYCGDQADNRHNMSLYLFFLIFRLRCPGGQPPQITFKRTKHLWTVIVIILVQVWLNMIMTLQKIEGMPQFWGGCIGECGHHSKELGSNTFLEATKTAVKSLSLTLALVKSSMCTVDIGLLSNSTYLATFRLD